MAPLETPTSAAAPIDIERAALGIAKREATKAKKIGGYGAQLRAEAQQIFAGAGVETDGTTQPDVKPTTEIAQVPEAPATKQLIETATAEERKQIAASLNRAADAVDKSTGSHANFSVDASMANTTTLGQAQVGGGDSSVLINSEVLVSAAFKDGVQLKNVTAHEDAHANLQAAPQSDVMLGTGVVVTSWDLLEGHAEIVGAEAVGIARREGQPGDYAEAQTKAETIVSIVGRSTFDDAIGSGQTDTLQQAIWEKQLGTGSITTDEVQDQAEELEIEDGAEEAILKFVPQQPKAMPVPGRKAA